MAEPPEKRAKPADGNEEGMADVDTNKQAPAKLKNMSINADLPALRSMYYARLFPIDLFCQWLGYGNVDKDCLRRREMSFTLDGDIYIRYLSYKNTKEMHKDLIDRNPEKIDIGAIYNMPAADRMSVAAGVFVPQEREFVIDIDLSDYNDVRTCCDAAGICTRCWPYMSVAVKTLDAALRDDFGFKHIMWVYSGRRGVHCWVSDRRARLLSNDARSAVAEYLSCYVGGTGRQVDLTYPLHPSMKRVYETVLKPRFENLLIGEQKILNGEDDRQKAIEHNMLEMITDPSLKEEIQEKWTRCDSGWDKWEVLQKEVQKLNNSHQKAKGGISKSARLSANCIEDIVFAHLYPRLDIAVSRHLNHLLKAPFAIHPKTGRVCTPMDISKIDDFDPERVPTVGQLYTELDQIQKVDRGKEWEKTSMAESVRVFTEFVRGMDSDHAARRKELGVMDEAIDFLSDALDVT
jgi:DNA primase small subunit